MTYNITTFFYEMRAHAACAPPATAAAAAAHIPFAQKRTILNWK